tara:strand:- start:239 stop:451 length:213 start_codon:yes stop_codon:yes gene_type:complete
MFITRTAFGKIYKTEISFETIKPTVVLKWLRKGQILYTGAGARSAIISVCKTTEDFRAVASIPFKKSSEQ